MTYRLKPKKKKKNSDLNDSIFRTLGAAGIFIKREVAKKERRLLASKFAGISIALSFTVSSNRNRSICSIQNHWI